MKKKKEASQLKEEYKKSFAYIKECKKFIYSIILIFFIFAIIGFFVPAPTQLSEQIKIFIQELLEKTQAMSSGELIQFIFLNNVQSSFFGLIFGVLLGIFPVLAAVSNGYLLGYVAAESVKEGGILVLWRIFPHGIFELPAIFISLGMGMKLGMFVSEKNKIKSLKKYLWNSLKTFLLIIVPLLIIAGIIEGSLISLFG